MLALIEMMDLTHVSFHKVRSHGDLEASESPFDDWAYQGNNFADLAAKRSNWERDPDILTLLANYQMTDEQLRQRGNSHRAFLLAVAHFDLEKKIPGTDEVEDLPLSTLLEVQTPNDCAVAAALEPCMDISVSCDHGTLRISPEIMKDAVHWLSSVDITSSHKQFVSLAELVFGFRLQHEAFPTRSTEGGVQKLTYPSQTFLGALSRQTLAGSISVMKSIIEASFGFAQAELVLERRPRTSVGIVFPVLCLEIGWPTELHDLVASAFQRFSSHFVRKSQDLARTYGHVFQ